MVEAPDPHTVLVTGGAGYIGSHTCRLLAAGGFRPIAYDNLSTGHDWAVKWGPLERGELADGTRLREVMRKYRPAAVIHFAASIAAGESVIEPLKYYRNNVAGSLALIEAMRDCAVPRIVFSSTAAVYGNPQTRLLSEAHPLAPINPYGASKLMVETMLRDAAAAHGLIANILRYFNASGADPDAGIGEDHEPETHLIPRVLFVALGKEREASIFGADYPTPDGTCVRDYIHILDLAEAHLCALKRELPKGSISVHNLGTGHGYSVKQIMEVARRITGHPIPVSIKPRRPGDPPELVADPALALQELNWRPTRSSLERLIADAWAWHKTRHG
ncbi:MAG: UDP-glucose 4-epimerase GalE [Alphaproteobacteria bacterium]|nr:UDP-glucose 4-epimerase GalE [Alphaproteobacteria bacterium]